ncbi:MAG TPA: 50S ribosomal protein L21 [Caulobacteraceae bacterium]
MYAVIQTGGKQYRVKPGDLLIVERLEGEPGAVVAFDRVLMIGEGADVTVGAPVVVGASVSATLVETRKGKKIKVFKKIRRQGYRRTRGHRQFESVLRVTALAAGERNEVWDGEVDLTPLAALNARARNLARAMKASQTIAAPRPPKGKTQTKQAKAKATAKKSVPAKSAAAAPKKGPTKAATRANAEKKPAKVKTAPETTKKTSKAKPPPAAKAKPKKAPGTSAKPSAKV